MLDTRGSGKEYSRSQINRLTKLADLYTNDSRGIYAELLCDSSEGDGGSGDPDVHCDHGGPNGLGGPDGTGGPGGQKVYFREWLTSHGTGDSCSFAIINSMSELKEELKKDVDHGDLAPGKLSKICDQMTHFLS